MKPLCLFIALIDWSNANFNIACAYRIVYIQGKWLANYTTVSWYTEWQMTNTAMYQCSLDRQIMRGCKQLKWAHVT